MQLALKTLFAVACISVTIAAGVVVMRVASTPTATKPLKEPPGSAALPEPPNDKPRPAPTPVWSQPNPAAPTDPGTIPVARTDPLQPQYRPVNNPVVFQNLRREGKTYRSKVVGKMEGRASKKDWAIRGTAFFEYIYAIESSGKILSNDGAKIVEERSFGVSHEELLVSAYRIGIEIPERLDPFLEYFAKPVAMAAGAYVAGPEGARTGMQIVDGVQIVAHQIDRVEFTVKKEWIDKAGELGVFKVTPVDPRDLETEIRMIAQAGANKLLEGKKVRIQFLDGYGISSIVPIDCQLSETERDAIVRANFIIDDAIFPDESVLTAKEWTISASVLGGFVDPRLRGKPEGQCRMSRGRDFEDANKSVFQRLRMKDGEITITETEGGSERCGSLSAVGGTCLYSQTDGIITSAHLSGYARYNKLDKLHLLFEAECTIEPKFLIEYECEVR